ncbi:MAG: molybdate ABC transporter substrate-binding protein [Lachnospiraceae bacterium]
MIMMMVMLCMTGCGSQKEDEKLFLAAASSLEKVFTEELIPMFEEENPGICIEGTYDSSGKLQTQIEEGLKADIFMSAAVKQMTALDETGFMDSGSIVNLLENKLVVIVPAEGESPVSGYADFSEAEKPAIGDPESVPAGQYAREVLTNLGIWETIEAKASLGTNVTEVLNWVAEGSADAGIVYATDAAGNTAVRVLEEAPEGTLESPVIYPVGILKNTDEKEAAELFLEFLQSEEAIRVFENYGFARMK